MNFRNNEVATENFPSSLDQWNLLFRWKKGMLCFFGEQKMELTFTRLLDLLSQTKLSQGTVNKGIYEFFYYKNKVFVGF